MKETNDKRSGRKRLPDNKRRSQFFRIRLSPNERFALAFAAQCTERPLSEFIRAAALRESELVNDFLYPKK